MGFQQLQNIRAETLEAILEERERNGPFRHIVDFRKRIPILPAEGAVLVKSGALDSIACGLNRPRMLWYLESRSRAGGNSEGKRAPRGGEQPDEHPGRCSVLPTQATFRFPVRRESPQAQISNRGTPPPDPLLPLPPPGFDPESLDIPPLSDFDERRKWSHERETLGFVLSVHPLKLFDAAVRALPYPVLPASELHSAVGRRVRVLGWRITAKEVLTKEGEQMEFVSFEDETAIYEAVLFPDTYRRFCQDLDRDRPYVLYGIVESEFGAENLNVLELRKLDRPADRAGGSGRRTARSPAPGPPTTPYASGGRGG
jgi:error-prone DNA polymerase